MYPLYCVCNRLSVYTLFDLTYVHKDDTEVLTKSVHFAKHADCK
jgi:hypothetical protein